MSVYLKNTLLKLISLTIKYLVFFHEYDGQREKNIQGFERSTRTWARQKQKQCGTVLKMHKTDTQTLTT